MEVNNQIVERSKRVKGRVVLMKKGVLDFHDIKANVLDRVHELLGKGVSLQLISATTPDPGPLDFLIIIFANCNY